MPDHLKPALQILRDELASGLPHRSRLLHYLPGDFSAQVEGILVAEPLAREAIDSICQRWPAERHWPESDPETAALVFFRVEQAHALAKWLVAAEAEIETRSTDEILAWLLVAGWEEFGERRWREELLDRQEDWYYR